MMPKRSKTGGSGFVERRRAKRYKLALPVQLMKRGTGVTRDISTSGIFFETKTAQSTGDTINLSVDFTDATIRCEGRVVRAKKLDSKFGIAVELTSYAFD